MVRKRPIPGGAAGLPDRLREARERMYLSQSKLSLLAGLGRITVHNIEEHRTQGNVGIVTVEKLAKVLRVSPCWLAYGVDTSAAHHRTGGEGQMLEGDSEPVRETALDR